ncbi:T9SS type A sorting domain-containing protein [Spirosoma koreense]
MKRILGLLSLLLLARLVVAQEYRQQLSLSRAVTSGVVGEKATESIAARNRISGGATATYTAGRSVSLQPGFFALTGSVFRATIETVSALGDNLNVSVRAYPNPFAGHTTIEYHLPVGGPVRHTLLNASGRVLRQTETTTESSAGTHQTQIDAKDLPTGVYLYQLTVGAHTHTLRLIRK